MIDINITNTYLFAASLSGIVAILLWYFTLRKG